MNLTCYIIDDEPLAIEVIGTHAAEWPDLDVVDTFRNAMEAFRALGERPVDVIFLDIEMPRLTGLDLLRALTDPPLVVLTTAHREYAVDGFALDVVDYLVKPVRFERFARAMAKVERRAGSEGAGAGNDGSAHDAALTILVDRRKMRLPIANITWVESRRDRVEIHTGSRTLSTYYSLTELTEELEPHGFIRIHRSFLVAHDRIESWSATEVIVDGESLPIGRTYRAHVMGQLES